MNEDDKKLPERIKEKTARVRQHVRENKKVYLVGAGAGLTCFAAGYFLRPQVVNVVDSFNIKYKSPTETTIITVLQRRACRTPIPVRDKLTGESYASINRAAQVIGENARDIAKDVHGAASRFERLPDSVFA